VKNKPLSGLVVPRFAGISTFLRLPYVLLRDAAQIDVGLIGVPWDGGTTNRAGARHGPRQVREMSSLLRNVHHVTRVRPYDLANCADLGDVEVNPIDPSETLQKIEQFYHELGEKRVIPLSVGGDHLLSLGVLRALCRHESVGMIQIDAHSDTNDVSFDRFRYTHGTPFRRAVEEGLLDPRRTIQIGIRGSLYSEEDVQWSIQQGIRSITIEEFHDLGLTRTIDIARNLIGDGVAYLSFDIDSLDPAYAPGTGTPEIGGLSTIEVQRLLRGFRGLDFIGADVVEVCPPFDTSGNTALAAATMMFEILCLLAERVKSRS
jgi:guanidinopropionase